MHSFDEEKQILSVKAWPKICNELASMDVVGERGTMTRPEEQARKEGEKRRIKAGTSREEIKSRSPFIHRCSTDEH